MSRPHLFTIVEGWTAPMDAQLKLRGVAFDASGMTVTAVIHDKDGRAVTVSADWLAQASATTRMTPNAGDFRVALSPYRLRYKVVDAGGKVAFFPPIEETETIQVNPQ